MISTLTIKPDVLVFDCGDTLVELDPPKEAIFQKTLAEVGLDIELNLIEYAYRVVEAIYKQRSSVQESAGAKAEFFRNFNHSLCDVLGIRSHAAPLNLSLQQAFHKHRNWQADFDTKKFLTWATDHFDCYVLANWDRNLKLVLEKAGIAHHFRGIYCSQDFGAEKPDRLCFEQFLNVTNLYDKKRVYIGNDYVSDVLGSRACGFEPVLLDRYGRYSPAVDCLRVTTWDQLVPKTD